MCCHQPQQILYVLLPTTANVILIQFVVVDSRTYVNFNYNFKNVTGSMFCCEAPGSVSLLSSCISLESVPVNSCKLPYIFSTVLLLYCTDLVLHVCHTDIKNFNIMAKHLTFLD